MTRIDLSPGILLLSDDARGSYEVIGDLLAATLSRAGISVERTRWPRERPPHVGRRVVVQNTIGPLFAPVGGARNVALVHHEWDRYPSDWTARLNAFDEVWVTTEFVGETLRRSGVTRRIVVTRPALDLDPVPRKSGYRAATPFRVLSCGEPHFRKGFHLLIAGYLEAFPHPGEASLTIKTSPACDWSPPRADIHIVRDRLDRASLLAYYRTFDLYATASLGEGLGLPVAEAVLAGLPVAANYWGGHRSVIEPPLFFRIAHREVPQPFSSQPSFYASGQCCGLSQPSDVAAALLAARRASASSRRRLALAARRSLLARYGWNAVRRSYASRQQR